jgi:hypothetical protein
MNKNHVIHSIGEPECILHGEGTTEFLMYPTKGVFIRVRDGKVHSYGSIKDHDFTGLTKTAPDGTPQHPMLVL